MQLSGTYHPIEYIIERLSELLPMVKEHNALWMGFDRELQMLNSIDGSDWKIKAQQIRSLKSKVTNWHNSDAILTYNKSERKQLSINDENELNVLYLFFQSPVDGLNDILTLTFPDRLILKNLDLTFNKMNTHEKSIVSSMINAFLSDEFNRVVKERKFLVRVQQFQAERDAKIEQLKSNLKATEELYSTAITNILNELKSKYEKKLNRTFIFERKIIYQLAKGGFSLKTIQQIIEEAIFLAYNLSPTKSELTISSEYIDNEQIIHKTTKQSSTSNSRKDKVLVLLNRYEEAAEKLVTLGKKINGKNIAAHLTPPITPPAISDAVKKNKKKIDFLFKQYPSRWPKIRKGIKPIQVIEEQATSSTMAS